MKNNNLFSQKGFTLGTVLIYGTIIALLVFAGYKFLSNYLKLSTGLGHTTKALYTARAGIEFGLFALRNERKDYKDSNFLKNANFSKSGNTFTRKLDVTNPFGIVALSKARESTLVQVEPYIAYMGSEKTKDGIRTRYLVKSTVTYYR